MRLVVLLLRIVLVIGLAATACSRTDTLGPEEAIEVMVLDGVDRARATCIVNELDGELSLEKITGIDTDLSEEELGVLASTSAQCAPTLPPAGGIIGGNETDEASTFDIEGAVFDLIENGLDPFLRDCLVDLLYEADDPEALLEDEIEFSAATFSCREEPTGTIP